MNKIILPPDIQYIMAQTEASAELRPLCYVDGMDYPEYLRLWSWSYSLTPRISFLAFDDSSQRTHTAHNTKG